MMIKFKSACSNSLLIVALNCASVVWAESVQNTEVIPEDNPTQLQSIPLLQSLKNLKNERHFQAPYVHELNNRYKVRTLFVETKANQCLMRDLNTV